MEIAIMNKEYDTVRVLDSYSSLIWSDRYSDIGTMELTMTPQGNIFKDFELGNYVIAPFTDSVMIIEDFRIITRHDDSPQLILEGRCLNSILDRRIIYEDYIIRRGSFYFVVTDIIDSNLGQKVIPGHKPERVISNYNYKDIYSLYPWAREPFATSHYGENLFDKIKDICDSKGVGFKTTWDEYGKQFIFHMYKGEDRSYAQELNPPVIFAHELDNLLEANVLWSRKNYKNVVLPKEGERLSSSFYGNASGLERREFIHELNFSSELSEADKEELRTAYLKDALAEHDVINAFEGEIIDTMGAAFKVDYWLGDIIQIVTPYGQSFRARVVEMTYSFDESGFKKIPTFETL